MLDITKRKDHELTNQFLHNDELFGEAVAAIGFCQIEDTANELFIYTDDQLADLRYAFREGEMFLA